MQYGATVHVELFSFPQNNGMIIKTFYFASWLQLHPPNKASGDHRQVIKSGVWTKQDNGLITCGSWSVTRHIHKAPMSWASFHLCRFAWHKPCPIQKWFSSVHEWHSRSKVVCMMAGLASQIQNRSWPQYPGGTAAAAPSLFRPSEPAHCGSRPLGTPY